MSDTSNVKVSLTAHFASYNSPTRRANLNQEEGESIWAACRANGFHPVSIRAQEKTPAHAKWPVFALRNKREWDSSAPGIGLVAGALDAERKDPTGSPLRVPGVGRTLFLDFDIHAESRPGLDGAAVRDAFLSLPTVRRLLAEGALLRYREACGSGFVLVVRNAGDVGNTRPRYHADREHWPAIGTDEAGRERFDYGSPAGMDIIAAGGQAVCFAIHPSGAPYLWADGRSPANVHLDTLPTVDAETVARLIEEVTAALATFHLAPRSKTYEARFKDSPIRAARVTPVSQSDRDWLHDATIDLAIFDDGSDRRNFWRNAARVFFLLGDAPEAALERWADYYSPRNSGATFEKAEAEAVAQMEKPAGAEDALGPGAYLRWLRAAARGAERQDVADRIGELMSSHHISDGKAFDSIAEADGALPERQERKRQQKAESTTRARFATFEQGTLFTGDDDIFGEADALPAVSGPKLLAALESDARFADDRDAMLAAHRAVNAIIREPQVADTAERLTQLRALVEDGELPAHAETKQTPSVRRFAIASDLARDWRPTKYVVNKWIPEGEVGFMFGPSKSRKSFVAMDIAAHVVCGRPWRDWETKRAGVIYWATEGAGGVAGRFKAWLAEYAARYGLDDELRVAVVTDRLDLKTKEGRRPLREMIGDYNATFRDLPCGLVFIDTWNKAVRLETGQDIELSPIISELESLARKNATTICALGHPGKDLSRGMKGSIVYETDATFRMKVVKERSGLTKIEIDKQKEGEDGICELIAFRSHNLGEDDFGRMATSLAAVPKGDAFEAVAEDRDGAGAIDSQEASDVSLLQAIEAGGYTFTTLATAAGLRSKGSVSERLDRLADDKLVKALGGGKFSLTRKGRQKVTDWQAALEAADADYEAPDDDDA